MKLALGQNGDAAIRISFADWIKAIAILAAFVWGHAQFQCAKIDAVATRLSVAETKLHTSIEDQRALRSEMRETAKELRDGFRELSATLRDR